MQYRVTNFMPVFIKIMLLFMLLKMLKYSRIPIQVNILYKAYLNLIIVKFVVVNFILLSKEFTLKIVYYYVIGIADLESDLGLFERSLVSELLLFSRRTTNANACDMRSK